MPRLTTKNYLRNHDQLRKLWLRDPALFSELSTTHQWLLHDFFRPDQDWSDLQLLQYREAITSQRPSLPHQAGRALSQFWATTARVGLKRVRRSKAPVVATRVRQADRRLIVKPLVHSEIDTKKLARAYIRLAHDLAKKRSDQNQSAHDDRSRP